MKFKYFLSFVISLYMCSNLYAQEVKWTEEKTLKGGQQFNKLLYADDNYSYIISSNIELKLFVYTPSLFTTCSHMNYLLLSKIDNKTGELVSSTTLNTKLSPSELCLSDISYINNKIFIVYREDIKVDKSAMVAFYLSTFTLDGTKVSDRVPLFQTERFKFGIDIILSPDNSKVLIKGEQFYSIITKDSFYYNSYYTVLDNNEKVISSKKHHFNFKSGTSEVYANLITHTSTKIDNEGNIFDIFYKGRSIEVYSSLINSNGFKKLDTNIDDSKFTISDVYIDLLDNKDLVIVALLSDDKFYKNTAELVDNINTHIGIFETPDHSIDKINFSIQQFANFKFNTEPATSSINNTVAAFTWIKKVEKVNNTFKIYTERANERMTFANKNGSRNYDNIEFSNLSIASEGASSFTHNPLYLSPKATPTQIMDVIYSSPNYYFYHDDLSVISVGPDSMNNYVSTISKSNYELYNRMQSGFYSGSENGGSYFCFLENSKNIETEYRVIYALRESTKEFNFSIAKIDASGKITRSKLFSAVKGDLIICNQICKLPSGNLLVYKINNSNDLKYQVGIISKL